MAHNVLLRPQCLQRLRPPFATYSHNILDSLTSLLSVDAVGTASTSRRPSVRRSSCRHSTRPPQRSPSCMVQPGEATAAVVFLHPSPQCRHIQYCRLTLSPLAGRQCLQWAHLDGIFTPTSWQAVEVSEFPRAGDGQAVGAMAGGVRRDLGFCQHLPFHGSSTARTLIIALQAHALNEHSYPNHDEIFKTHRASQ